jgi:Carboxypeptidase regulatory-like domain
MLLFAGMFLTFCFALLAQEAVKTSSIVVEVKDQSGAFVTNAHIQVVPAPNNIGKNLTTALGGKVSLDLSPGSYDLTVESSGFVKATKRVEVITHAAQTIEIVLKIGSCPPGVCGVVTDVFPVSFPTQAQAVSPDGRYAIAGVDSGTEPYHSVFLEDRSVKTRRKLFNYDRRIVLLWKSDSKLFAVTDYVGSDSSRCSILSVDENVPPIQVLDVLSRQFSAETWKQLENRLSKDHVYVEAAVWDGPTSLMVKISGHGDADPGGFTEFAEVLLPIGHP